jgi:hypothetical protein
MNPHQINARFVGNPAFGLLEQWKQQGTPYQGPQQQSWYNPYTQQVFRPVQQPQYYDQTITVPGYNPTGGVGILPANIEDICNQMDVDMMLEQQEAAAKMSQRAQGYYNANPYGWNYYGTPYVSFGYDQSITNKYMDKLKEISQQAIQSKREFNKNLSRIVHAYLKDGVTEEDINRIYDGYSYIIPASSIQEYQTQERLYNTVPFDNTEMYRQASLQVTREYQSIAPKGQNMAQFFECAGMFFIMEEYKKEQHRRRNTKQCYDSNIYTSYLRKYALEHDIQRKDQQHSKEVAEQLADLAIQKGDKVTKGDIMNILYTPQQIASLKEQGFIIHPDGSAEVKVPDYILNQPDPDPPAQVINAENEIDYEMRRSAFIASIYNNNRSQVGG